MKIYIFSKPNDEANEGLELLLADLSQRNLDYQLIDPEAREFAGLAQAYDIMATPTVVVAQDDNSVVEIWLHSLPSANQVQYALGMI